MVQGKTDQGRDKMSNAFQQAKEMAQQNSGGNGGKGGGGKGGSNRVRRVWMPPESSKIFLFLENFSAPIREHSYGPGRQRQYATCSAHGCPDCQSEDKTRRWAPVVAFATVYQLSAYRSKSNRVYFGERAIFAAKWGGKDKPGSLQRLAAQYEEKNICGAIIKCQRIGQKSDIVGDLFTEVGHIAPDVIRNADEITDALWEEYMLPAIHAELDPRIQAYLDKEVNVNRDRPRTIEDHYKYNPIELIDWKDYLNPSNNPRSNELSFEPKDSEESSESTAPVDSLAGGGFDDDVPF